MDIAHGPVREHGDTTCQFTVRCNHLIGSTTEHRIIYAVRDRRTEHRLVIHCLVIQLRLVVLFQFCFHLMGSRLQFKDGGSGGRQPRVLHVEDGLVSYSQVIFAGHILPHIQHDGVTSFFRDGQSCSEYIVLAHFLLASFSRSHVHFPCPVFFSERGHFNHFVCRIEVG